jgi:cysteine desulfurase
MLGNNEIGSVNNISKLAELLHRNNAVIHCDATQAAGKIPISVDSLDVDLLSLSSHKIHGPKGAGALYQRKSKRDVSLQPFICGGGQENGLRAGTHNVPAIVGFGKACEIALSELNQNASHLSKLSSILLERLQGGFSGVKLNGPKNDRLPGNLNIALDGVDSASLIGKVSSKLSISSSSACTSSASKPSHVLTALGLDESLARSSIRIGIGRFNTEEEILFAADTIAEAANSLK